MKCAADICSGAVGVCLSQGRRTEGDRRDRWHGRAGMRWRTRAPDRLCGDRRPADGVRPGKPFYRAAATESDGRTAGTADRDALFGGDRQCRLGEQHQARGSRARICARDQVSRRPGGEEGHAAVRDRAGALQGSVGAGPSSGGGRQGDARQCRSRIHAAAGTAGQGRLDPSQSRQGAGQPRHGAGQCAASTGQYPERGNHARIHHGVGPVRRRRHRAQSLGRRTGRREPTERARDHRPDQPDLGLVQPQRTRRSARPRLDGGTRRDRCRAHKQGPG